MITAYLNVQCTEKSGEIGCFLTATKGKQDRVAISPIFPDLMPTFKWMRENGWELATTDEDGKYDPWRVAKFA